MKKAIRWVSTLLLAGSIAACTGRAAEKRAADWNGRCCKSRYPRETLAGRSTDILGKEYRRLKGKKCGACNFSGSALRVVMLELGTRLNGQPTTEIQRLLGPPDTIRDQTLVYYWRGEHDYLKFQLGAAGTAESSWYYAWE